MIYLTAGRSEEEKFTFSHNVFERWLLVANVYKWCGVCDTVSSYSGTLNDVSVLRVRNVSDTIQFKQKESMINKPYLKQVFMYSKIRLQR